MVREIEAQIIDDFPEYARLNYLLGLAEITYPAVGLSVDKLAMLEDDMLTMIALWARHG